MNTVWRFTGPPENWITGLGIGYWAVNEKNKGIWKQISSGDIGLLHSTAVSGYSRKTSSVIAGYAVIGKRKFTKKDLWWIQEIQGDKLMWPYVLSLDKVYLFNDQSNVDFQTLLQEKAEMQVTQEVEELAASGIKISDLNSKAHQIDSNVPDFPVNGSCSRVNPIYEELLLNSDLGFFTFNSDARDFTEIEQRYAESIDEELSDQSKETLLAEASAYKSSGPSHVVVEKKQKLRKENVRQKRIVARLEDYTCQICGFKCAYTNSKGKKGWIIEVDHILPKADGTGEELNNLWALCPNCHVKKTRGVIKIDPIKKTVKENGDLVKITDNHLSW